MAYKSRRGQDGGKHLRDNIKEPEFLTFATGSFQKEFTDSSPRLCRKERKGEASNKARRNCYWWHLKMGREHF